MKIKVSNFGKGIRYKKSKVGVMVSKKIISDNQRKLDELAVKLFKYNFGGKDGLD